MVLPRRLATLATLLTLLFTVACAREVQVTPTPGASPPVSKAGPKVYRLGIFEDLTTTNYWAYLGPDTTIWNSYVLSGGQPALYGYSDQRFDWVPSLADGFPSPLKEETADGKTFWTTEVNFKKGVKWSDGKDVTTSDFVFTAHTVLDLQLTGNWTSYVDSKFFDRAEALDPYKLKVFFKEKPGLAKWQFGTAFMPILPKAYWEPVVNETKKQGDFTAQQKALFAHVPSNEPGAGGFNFKRWEKAAFAEKSKNPNYFFSGATVTEYASGAYAEAKAGVYSFSAYGEPTGNKVLEYTTGPYADSSIYSIYGSQDTAVLALKKGDIDFMLNPLGLQRGLQEQLKGQAGLATIENPSNGFRYLGFNVRRPPMDSKAFRQAVATLTDKEFMTNTVLQGVAIPMYTTVPEGNGFWYNSNVPLTGKGLSRGDRIAQAVALLKGAGFTWQTEPKMSQDGRFVEVEGKGLKMPNGQPVPSLEILAPSAGYDPLRSTFAIWIERWLNEVGIPTKARLTGFNVIVETIKDPQRFDMWILGWGLTLFPDYLEAFFHSRHTVGDGLNRGGYSNPDFDKLADELLGETDLNEARKKVFKMQEFLADDLPYVVLFTTPVLETYRSDLLKFPYTQTLGGLQNLHGLTTTVVIK
jgi:ABC-type transport system substrate-binding protein